MIREHLLILEHARETLDSTTPNASSLARASISAHKLAGSLGMFGYHLGTELARKLEVELDSDHSPDPALVRLLLQQLTASLGL